MGTTIQQTFNWQKFYFILSGQQIVFTIFYFLLKLHSRLSISDNKQTQVNVPKQTAIIHCKFVLKIMSNCKRFYLC